MCSPSRGAGGGADRARRIAIRHKTVILRKIEPLVVQAGLDNAPTLAHQIGLLIDGAIIAAMVTRNPGVADDAGSVLRVLLDSGKSTATKSTATKPAARRIAPPKLRTRNPVHA